MKRQRALTGGLQRPRMLGRAREDVVSAGGRGQLERPQVVVREHLRPILGAVVGERLDPLGRAAVARRRGGARDLPVGDVAHEHVPERVLVSPATEERRSRRTNSLRSSACSALLSGHGASVGDRARRVRARRPSRARPRPGAAPSPPAGGASRRAAMIPWTVSGSARPSMLAALGLSMRTYSSA